MDLRQSPNYIKYMESMGWVVEKAGNCNVFIKKLPFLLNFISVIKIQQPPEPVPLGEISKLAKKHRALFINIEPVGQTSLPGFDKSEPLIPSKTIILPLEKITLDTLPKDTRYEIRKAEKANVRIKHDPLSVQDVISDNNLLTFIKLWHKNAIQRGFWVPLNKEIKNLAASFGKNALLFLAYQQHNGESKIPISGALVLLNEDSSHYMYAFSTHQGRKVSAPYLVMWEIIKYLKDSGVSFFDLEGVYDSRFPKSTKNWQGFTKFKEGWNGKVVEYPGSFISLPRYLRFLR